VALGCVAALHAVVLWIFTTAAVFNVRIAARPELQVTLFNPRLPPAAPPVPPSSWTFKLPEEVNVPEPQITITPAIGTGNNTQANETSERLAPTLDPSHVNGRPELPGTLGRLIAELALRLNILVLPDGSVFEARIVKSTGEAEIDRLAAQWVKTNWRFLPALQNGQPVEAWTTVMVRFAPIH
jgi:protein TonB